MLYENLYIEFKKQIPESEQVFKIKEEANLIDETDGAHVCFSLIVVPYIIELVLEKEMLVAYRVFEFIEKMALSEDKKVSEVLDFTILEELIDDGKNVLDECKKFMLPNTTKRCEKIEEYFVV